jgi:23S rRNA pseudouridine1911/1915/1917 synthase
MPDTVVFQVLASSTERLDRFLADQLSLSRTQAARLVAQGGVQVNGARGRASRGLFHGDLVAVEFPEHEPRRTLRPHPVPLEVVYEDDTLLVIDKPSGMVVHPAPGHWDDTLVNALLARGTALAGENRERPGIVHRLDRDTSGLLIIAKTDTAHRRLGRALAARRIERQYAALIWGHIRDALDVDEPIGRHPNDRKRMVVLATGRPAKTRAERLARFDTCDLVRITLGTGRTHQIRVHLSHVGHPVVGDPIYGGGGHRRVTGSQRQLALAVERAAPRQVLHAAFLRFAHPETGESLQFRSEWPSDLRKCLETASGDPTLLAPNSVLEYLGFFG